MSEPSMPAHRRMRSRAATVGAAALLALPLAAATADAAVPDGQGAIHGCYGKTTGLLRVIDPASANRARNRCLSAEFAVTWNQAGVAGIPGAAGAQGPQGPQGPAGGGLSGFEEIDGQIPLAPVTGGGSGGELNCPDGKAVLNAGYNIVSGSANPVESRPNGIDRWRFTFRSTANGGGLAVVYMICVDGAE